MSVDRELDRILAALERAGAPAPPGPVPPETIANFEALVAPLELPAELLRLWERVNPGGLAVAPWPDSSEGLENSEFADPALTWWAFRRQLDEPDVIPEALLCVSSLLGRFRFVELAGAHGSGGTVYAWATADRRFIPEFASIGDWLGTLAQELEDGAFRTIGEPGACMLFVDAERYARRERPPGKAPLGAWREASRHFDGKRKPKPADRSISELLWQSADRRVEATISGLVERRLWSERGTRVLICDGTGLIDAYCDASVSTEWMLRSYRGFEVDLLAGPDLEHQPLGGGGGSDPHFDALRPQAHVTALRPYVFG